jgi:hypothetical protein
MTGRAARGGPHVTPRQRSRRACLDPVVELAEAKMTDAEWLDFVQSWLPWTVPVSGYGGSWE